MALALRRDAACRKVLLVDPTFAMDQTSCARMSSLKEIKLAEKRLADQKSLVMELNGLIKDIERSEQAIAKLKSELETINGKYQGTRTTRQDIEYLSGLLDCAKKKLNWEKQLASLQKRTPLALEQMTRLLIDPKNPPNEEVRAAMLQALQGIQAAMERLQKTAS
jgi:predicted RNase H-like nuclease (RuvC/YqgF family)